MLCVALSLVILSVKSLCSLRDTFVLFFCISYPPEVFPVGLFGDVVFGVDFSLQGPEASPLRDVFFAEHACYLEHKCILLLLSTPHGKYDTATLRGS